MIVTRLAGDEMAHDVRSVGFELGKSRTVTRHAPALFFDLRSNGSDATVDPGQDATVEIQCLPFDGVES